MKTLTLILIFFMMTGCSYKGAYEGIQISKRNQCTQRPSSQYKECMEATKLSYQKYEKERKEVLAK